MTETAPPDNKFRPNVHYLPPFIAIEDLNQMRQAHSERWQSQADEINEARNLGKRMLHVGETNDQRVMLEEAHADNKAIKSGNRNSLYHQDLSQEIQKELGIDPEHT